ncbi:MFS transporter [Mycobacterium koreense]|uniref:MFS transporter n=1 Tax=Mycolicibacillus koreensis TaxID=1069220 RepID=A0A7I7S9E5_9MYCO|nr:MFS transporter [Mycolicibacillus koreensis]MCV7247859.1 MFS transporter [Mycolicibacillus koreensis]OSC33030.1 MFS transporter [Mycolicibacillus koreensis]BBY53001.1 MFS transporter [Mycolicibacillus koreensis]
MRSWIVWSTGLIAYIVAVLNRTTFGVSGLDAADRFAAGPGVLSWFVVLQVIVYAAMQIPAGVLLDHFGPRRMIASGAAVMAVGQLVMGITGSLPVAVSAYALVGLGDALTFIAVIRLIPNWFPASRAPLLTQLTALCGQTGQILSAVPFVALLLRSGWTVAYVSAAALSVMALALTLCLVRDTPHGHETHDEAPRLRRRLAAVPTVLSRPGTRLGFFTHMGTQFPLTVFVLMWGVPYLTRAQGLSRSSASALLTLSVLVFIVTGVLVGMFSGRHPSARPRLVLATIAGCALMWAVVLALPTQAPHWLLVMLVVVISAAQPVSLLAFDFARDFNPSASLGTAQGTVNMGGFLASLLVMQLMGLIIGAGDAWSFEAFRAAWLTQYLIWAIAAAAVVINARNVGRGGPARSVSDPAARVTPQKTP